MLASVALLCFFIFFVFGILAVQLWMGVFHQRCYDPSTGNYFENDDGEEDPYLCTLTSEGQSGMNTCPPNIGAGLNYTECRQTAINPIWGAINFDNIGAAWEVIFQSIAIAGWVDIMYLTQGAYSFWVWIYYVGLIIIGGFFAVNLTLVVISAQFGATRKENMQDIATSLANEKETLEKERMAMVGMRKRSLWEMIIECTIEPLY